jgi:hypothetical protein
MRLISHHGATGCAIVSLGGEEAVILLQPGGMVRSVLDPSPARAAAARFLTPLRGEGVLAVLPEDSAAAILRAPATHSVERDLQMLLFDNPNPNPSHESRPAPPSLLR